MRPALSAREIRADLHGRVDGLPAFNEARAFCAGNRAPPRHTNGVLLPPSMRPALSAREITLFLAGRKASFYPSMRPALSAREIDPGEYESVADVLPSMRPALSAREIPSRLAATQRRTRAFNEARAFCAGNLRKWRGRRTTSGSFNEARAFCAGNPPPDRRGPQAAAPFNEARAFCAGNHGMLWDNPNRPGFLQ